MAREPDRPIDDEMCQSVRAEDLIRNRGAPTRLEEVTLEEEERDTRPPHCAEHVVEPGGIEAVAHGIALGAAIGRRRGADYGVDRAAATSRDERDESAEGLPCQYDTAIPQALQRLRLDCERGIAPR